MFINIKGYSVEIDDCNSDLINNGYTWQVRKDKPGCIYFYRWLPRKGNKLKKREYLHKLIIGNNINKLMVDHIDGNTCNNKRENLRFVTAAQNVINRKGYGKTGYKGVSYFRRDKLYRARIRVNGIAKILGYRKTPEAAYELYKTASALWHGEFARIAPKEAKAQVRAAQGGK